MRKDDACSDREKEKLRKDHIDKLAVIEPVHEESTCKNKKQKTQYVCLALYCAT